MSTRATLWYSDELHLYQDGLDDENVYLEIRSQYFEKLVVKIPLAAWKEMRQHTIQPAERYLDMSDDELRREAESQVDEHVAYLAQAPDSKFKGLLGSFVFGSPDSSREAMIERFLRFHRPAIAAPPSVRPLSDD